MHEATEPTPAIHPTLPDDTGTHPPARAPRILVVDDEPPIADLVAGYVTREGWEARAVADGIAAVSAVRDFEPDVVVLDLMLPGLDGIEVCRQLRGFSDAYVLMLTARSEEVDRVAGLTVGADDYLAKPFSPRELVARVRAILRRSESGRRAGDEPLTVGSVVVDTLRRDVRADGVEVQLTAREFDLLAFFAENPGIVLSRQQLLDGVWGSGWYGDERTVDVHVRQLRRKLGDALPLATVWGVGYRCG